MAKIDGLGECVPCEPLPNPALERFAVALAEGWPICRAYEIAAGARGRGSLRQGGEREAVRWFKSDAVTFRVAWLRFRREAALEEAVARLGKRRGRFGA